MKLEIEIFRIISAFGIVWFHSNVEAGREIAYGGLIFFIVVSAYFATISTRFHSLFERVERLLIPCFLWAIFYGVINLVTKGYVFPDKYILLSIFLATPSIHLWFLPFIFFSLIAIDKFRQLVFKEWGATLIGISAILSISLAPIWLEFDYIPPLGQYAHAIPAVLIGVFFGIIDKAKVKMLLITGIILSVLIMVFKQQSGIGIPYLVGLIPCYFFFFNSHVINNKGSLLLKISSATLGVYLIHIFVLMVLRKLGIVGFSLPLFAFILSLLAIIFLKTFVPKKIVKYVA